MEQEPEMDGQPVRSALSIRSKVPTCMRVSYAFRPQPMAVKDGPGA